MRSPDFYYQYYRQGKPSNMNEKDRNKNFKLCKFLTSGPLIEPLVVSGLFIDLGQEAQPSQILVQNRKSSKKFFQNIL